ncbi:MAG TPA: zinc dependent phospholipase C family protein [Polyangia bacterium]|nr:zinc dependent phospholipase C family protein [Polyangia bacterium]
MPAPQFHLTFGQLVKDQQTIHPALRRACSNEPVYVRLGSIFHDLPYYGNMLAEAVRYGLGSPALDEPWAYRMHSVRPDRFVASFIRAAATTPGPLTRDERLALCAGLVSHAALDLTLHPLVNYCARRDTAAFGAHESMHHRLTEKYQALFFHMERLGHDPIGTPEFRQMSLIVKDGSITQAKVEWPIVEFMQNAYRGVYGDAPDPKTWMGWVRSFRHFGLLVSLPIAQLNSTKKHRDPLLKPRYFENEVFRFWDFYAASERRLVELCNLAYAYFDAGEFTRATEDAFVRAAQIDDLAEPGLHYPERLADLPSLPRLTVRCTPGITAPPGEPWRKRDRRRLKRRQRRSARVRRLAERNESAR